MADEDAPLLPELVRSLRSLGRPADAAAQAAHAAVFAPLLDARARATRGDAADALAAFRGATLAARIESLARAAATNGQSDPARGRARVAGTREELEPLRGELAQLDALASAAGRDGPRSEAWRRWLDQLHRVFTAADAACDAIARLLAERTETPASPRGWFRGREGRGG
jgi:hypothetical protein